MDSGALPAGIAEFSYLNNLPYILDIEIAAATRPAAPFGAPGERRPLVAVGGGKDSIVSIETLKRANLSPTLFAVRKAPLLEEIMALADVPMLMVGRQHDKRVPELLRQGGYKGHLPEHATHALVGVATALPHGLGPTVLSNERSAAVANLTWRDREINHQWSTIISGDVKGEYTPLLRALGITAIALGQGSAARLNALDLGPIATRWPTWPVARQREELTGLLGRWVKLLVALAQAQGGPPPSPTKRCSRRCCAGWSAPRTATPP